VIDIARIIPAERHWDDTSRSERKGAFNVDVMQTQGARTSQEDRFFLLSIGKQTLRDAESALQAAFAHTAEQTNALRPGATATVAVISTDNHLTIAHVGECPALLFIKDQQGHVSVKQVIQPHRAAAENNETPIKVSRAFGDAAYPAIGKTPNLTQVDLSNYLKPWNQLFFAVASGGLTQRARNQEHALILEQSLRTGQLDDAARLMKDHAARKKDEDTEQGSDNVTLLFTEIPPKRQNGLLLAVLDGHGGQETAETAAESLKSHLIEVWSLEPSPAVNRQQEWLAE
jgi:serine/threonine protein phosphatase PrpC